MEQRYVEEKNEISPASTGETHIAISNLICKIERLSAGTTQPFIVFCTSLFAYTDRLNIEIASFHFVFIPRPFSGVLKFYTVNKCFFDGGLTDQ